MGGPALGGPLGALGKVGDGRAPSTSLLEQVCGGPGTPYARGLLGLCPKMILKV